MKKIYFLLPLLIILTACDNSMDPDYFIPQPDTKTIDTEPDWSYSGRYIAYVHFAQDSIERLEGSVQIRILDLDSLTSKFLTEGYTPKWSPDDSFIAFEFGFNIYKINVETKAKYQLTNWGNCFFPSWSPDGNKITFDSNQFDPNGANVIWIMNPDGTNKRDISEHGTGEWREPNWSPDGDKILYSRYIGIGRTELFLMDTSGNNQFRLTFNDYDDHYSDWSKDGSKIAWYSAGEGRNNWGIWTMNSDGSNSRLLLKEGGHPSWSADGTEIVYSGIDNLKKIITLWIFNLKNGSKKQLF